MRILLFLTPLLLLISCVESEEEIWINASGSGKLRFHQTLPALAKDEIGELATYVEIIREIDKMEEGIEIQELSFEEVGSQLIFHLEANFDRVWELSEISKRHEERFIVATGADPEQMAAASGEIKIELEGLTPTFQRIVSLGNMIPAPVKMMPSLLGNSSSTFIIHLPVEVKETNAHQISDDKKTVTWKFLLKDHLETPMVMQLKSDLPIPWWVWPLGIFLGFLTLRFLRRKIRLR